MKPKSDCCQETVDWKLDFNRLTYYPVCKKCNKRCKVYFEMEGE